MVPSKLHSSPNPNFTGLCPDPTEGAYSAPTDPLSDGAEAHCRLPRTPLPPSAPFFSRTERRHTVHATVLLTCAPMWHVPEFIELENWPPNSLDLNPVDYSVCGGGALQQMVYHHKISAETRANRLLGSAKPGHVKSSDRSAAKKTDDAMVIKVRGARVEFRLDKPCV